MARFRWPCFLIAVPALMASASTYGESFVFWPGLQRPDAIFVRHGESFTDQTGFGFERSESPSTTAVRFSKSAAEGNYRVEVFVGSSDHPSTTTIRSELRRLMAGPISTAAGERKSVSFMVNVRNPEISGGGLVRLKPRERTGEFEAWDKKLTLEFDGISPAVAEIDISEAGRVPTIYLAGDSTVCDQPYEPFSSWGQVLPYFVRDDVAVANHAESGESARSFVGEQRLAKLQTLMKPGDFLLIQFGHNDQKEKGEGVGPFTSYEADLRAMIAAARALGATPVLVTSVSRRTFDPSGRIKNSFGDYLAAVRQVAAVEKVPLIDLNALSVSLYEAFGPERAKALFPTVKGVVEGTHHNDFGSYEIAKCVVQGIRANVPSLELLLKQGLPVFDPTKPDAIESYVIPATPKATAEVPYGN